MAATQRLRTTINTNRRGAAGRLFGRLHPVSSIALADASNSSLGDRVISIGALVQPGNSIAGSFRIQGGESGRLSIKGNTGGNVTHIFRIVAIGTSATDSRMVDIFY